MAKPTRAHGVSTWYTTLADHTFPTIFVKLKPEELALLAAGDGRPEAASSVLPRLEAAMGNFLGPRFVSADTTAPTDTERFQLKRGAVHSAESAWRVLAESERVRLAASRKEFEFLCVRPYRNMTTAREFRLFIREGRLVFMSQRWLTRHFRRIEGFRSDYWRRAAAFANQISWLLPEPMVAMDIYFTRRLEILIVDFNPWGPPTDPLLAKSWDRDWNDIPDKAAVLPPEA